MGYLEQMQALALGVPGRRPVVDYAVYPYKFTGPHCDTYSPDVDRLFQLVTRLRWHVLYQRSMVMHIQRNQNNDPGHWFVTFDEDDYFTVGPFGVWRTQHFRWAQGEGMFFDNLNDFIEYLQQWAPGAPPKPQSVAVYSRDRG